MIKLGYCLALTALTGCFSGCSTAGFFRSKATAGWTVASLCPYDGNPLIVEDQSFLPASKEHPYGGMDIYEECSFYGGNGPVHGIDNTNWYNCAIPAIKPWTPAMGTNVAPLIQAP